MELKDRKLVFSIFILFVVAASELEAVHNFSTNCAQISASNSTDCTSVSRQRRENAARTGQNYYLTPRPDPRESYGVNTTSDINNNGLSRMLSISPFPVFTFLKSFIKKPSVQYVPYKLKVKIPKIVKPILYLTDQGVTTDSPSNTIEVTAETESSTSTVATSTLFPTFNEESYHDNKYAAYAKYYGLGSYNKYGWKSKGKGHGKKKYHHKKGYDSHKKGKGKGKGHGWGWGDKKKGHDHKGKHKGKGKYKGHGKGKGKGGDKGNKGSVDYGWGWGDKSSSSKSYSKNNKGKANKKGTYPKYYDSLGNAYKYAGYGKTKSNGHYHKKAYQKSKGDDIIPIPYYRDGPAYG